MEKGKLLEQKCQKHFKENGFWTHRFYDSRSAGGFLPPQPADFMVIDAKGFTSFIECKESEETTIYAKSFRASQLKTMKEMGERGVNYLVIFLVKKRYYYVVDGRFVLDELTMNKKIMLKDYPHYFKIDEALKGML